jgi:hypothetical protein
MDFWIIYEGCVCVGVSVYMMQKNFDKKKSVIYDAKLFDVFCCEMGYE